jgi:hypothetical protein
MNFCQPKAALRGLNRLALLGSATALLAACGGKPDAEIFAINDAQGRWATAAGDVALVLPATEGTAATWLLARDVSSVTHLDLKGTESGSLKATGLRFTISGQVGQAQAIDTIDWTASLNTAEARLTLGSNPVFSRTSDLKTPATQTDAQGAWQASTNNGAVVHTWAVDGTGNLAGTSSTGCVYSGRLAARADVTVFDATVRESCNAVVDNFAGVATVSADRAAMTAVLVNTSNKTATALLFRK